MQVYRVKNWKDNFENNRTKDMVQMRWVPLPNKHDGDGYTDLISRANGVALYGGWTLILQVASKCGERGTLLRDGGKPHDAESIARVTRGDVKTIKEAIAACLEIGWLECIDLDGNTLQNPAPSCGLPAVSPQASRTQLTMEGKGMEGKELNNSAGARTQTVNPDVWFDGSAEEIFKAHPRPERKPRALQAIACAMSKIGAGKLLELTRQYAESQRGRPLNFIPSAENWFNEERYNEDPKLWTAWKEAQGPPAKPPPLTAEQIKAKDFERQRKAYLVQQGIKPKDVPI